MRATLPPATLPPSSQVFGPTKRLESIAALLAARVADLEDRIGSGDEDAWEPYLATVTALAAILPHVTPGARGELLTTREMAERLGITPKTLIRHKSKGKVRPALQSGKLIRWKGDEAPR